MEPTFATLAALSMSEVMFAQPCDFEPFLEHWGDVNDEEFDTPGEYLDSLAFNKVGFSLNEPLLFGIYSWEDGSFTASVFDGNHRLVLALKEDLVEIPYRIVRDPENTFPGYPYSGELGW
jgi:hypothetical protein